MNRVVTGLTSLAIVAGLSACGGDGDSALSIDPGGAVDLFNATDAEEPFTDAKRPETTERVRELEENVNDDLGDLVAEYGYVLTKNGIDLFEGAHIRDDSGDLGLDSKLYGAWLDNIAFVVVTGITGEVSGQTITARGGLVVVDGELTDTQLAGDATWVGVMVGTPRAGDQRDHILQGDAKLTYTMSEGEIDADFENIKNLTQLEDYSEEEFNFKDVPVDVASNTYRQINSPNNFIVGGFYGAKHAETAGTFAKVGIVGAFGAKKQ